MSTGRIRPALLHGEMPPEADLRSVGEARTALEEHQAASTRWSKEIPFDLGYSVKTYFIDDRIYVARYGSYAGSSLTCAVLLAYDRTTFQLQGVIPIAGCDGEQQDAISDVVAN